MRLLYVALFFLASVALAPAALAQSTATYRVTFESTWSAETHPDGFPPSPHYSGLIGAAHSASASLWAPGELASDGIESMAETGSKAQLRTEVEALIAQGSALAVLSGGGIGLSPGSVSMEFEVTEAHALVSLVSMLAPSPDWFVGVYDFDLRDGSAWATERVETLYVYDAGTDSGPDYTSPDQDTNPPEPISLIETSPFFVDGAVRAVGTFTFSLLSVVDAEDAAPAEAFALGAAAPNPAATQTALALRLGTPQTVRVDVFDVLGRRVAVLHDGALPAGLHPFRIDVRALPSGVYFVRARGTEQATRRFIVR